MENKGMGDRSPFTSFQQRTLIISAIIVILVIVVVGGFGLFVFTRANTPQNQTTTQKPTYSGIAAFTSSGRVDNVSLNGFCDGIEVSLHNVTPPANGHKYYVWLLADKSDTEGHNIMLGTLAVNAGTGYLKYQDPQYHNLLAQYSQLLVTEEDAQMMPVNPSPDTSTWRYSGVLPQTPNPNDPEHMTALDHLRHLLVNSPEQQQIDLQGGLAYWFDQNTHKLLEWASSTHGTMKPNDAPLMRRQFVRMMGYLNGTVPGYSGINMGGSMNGGSNNGGMNGGSNSNGSNNNGSMNGGSNSKSGMSTTVNVQNIPIPKDDYLHTGMIPLLSKNGYVSVIGMHIEGLRNSPNISSQQIQLINKIAPSVDFVNNQLETAEQDIMKLQKMSDKDLLGPVGLPVLDDMITHVNNAYLGTTDIVTGVHYDGAYALHQDMMQLAMMPLQSIRH